MCALPARAQWGFRKCMRAGATYLLEAEPARGWGLEKVMRGWGGEKKAAEGQGVRPAARGCPERSLL